MINVVIKSVDVKDIRFPSSITHYGGDAMHSDPDYSCTYVSIKTDHKKYTGYGITFTLGRGNEIVVEACKLISKLLIDKSTEEMYADFGAFWQGLINDPAIRAMDMDRGVARLAMAGVGNGLWDLWARLEDKPVWKLLSDMTPEQLVSNINFKYITDFITRDEAMEMLRQNEARKEKREEMLRKKGYPAYVSNIGSTRYSFEKIKHICQYYARLDFKMFKLPLHMDGRQNMGRCAMVRKTIGKKRELMLDANQIALTENAGLHLKSLKRYMPYWVEEPLHPDDVLGYSNLRTDFEGTVKLAGGEMYANRIEIKQVLQKKVLDFLQISLARLGGINDTLAAYFMAKKANVPICPHAGGLGLCEMAQHLQMWDFVCLSQTTKNRAIEFIDYKHGYFVNPVHIIDGNYMPPKLPGYSTMFKEKIVKRWSYPYGNRWKHLFSLGFPGYFQRKAQQKEGQRRERQRRCPRKKKTPPKDGTFAQQAQKTEKKKVKKTKRNYCNTMFQPKFVK